MDDILTAPEAPGLAVPSAPDDGGVADAAAALEHQVADPGSSAPAPTAATATFGEQPAPRPPGSPSTWQQQNRAFQENFRQRQLRVRQEAGQLREQKRLADEQIQESNRLLQTAIDAVKAGRPDAAVEPMPDPYTQGPEFAAWLAKQSEATVQKLLGPIAESVQWQRQQLEQAQQQSAQQTQQTEAQRARTEQFLGWEAAYQQAAPEASYGVRERFHSVRDVLADGFVERGVSPDEAQRMAVLHLHAIAQDAEARGENPVAAMDSFGTGVVMAMARRLGVEIVPVEPGDPLEGWGEVEGNGHQPAPAPAPPTEAQRLAAVRQRAGSVGNAGPRAPARSRAPQSETVALFRAGATVNELRAAALREAGGNMARASEILGALV